MPQTLTISLAHPISGLHVTDTVPPEAAVAQRSQSPVPEKEPGRAAEPQEHRLGQLCEILDEMTKKLNEFYAETVARSRGDIAKLAVEIARKILMWKIDKGDYDIQAIVEETLKRVPARQDIVIRLNPEDLPLCQQFQQDNPDGQFAELDLVGDGGVAHANCLIETPKGIVKSSVDECLERIGRALEKAQ